MTGITAWFSGKLGQDAQLRYTARGEAMLSFSVLVADYLTRTDDPRQWVRVACFGALAEGLAADLRRGDVVTCEGRLVVKLYEGRPDLEVYAWDVQLAPGRPAQTRRRGVPV